MSAIDAHQLTPTEQKLYSSQSSGESLATRLKSSRCSVGDLLRLTDHLNLNDDADDRRRRPGEPSDNEPVAVQPPFATSIQSTTSGPPVGETTSQFSKTHSSSARRGHPNMLASAAAAAAEQQQPQQQQQQQQHEQNQNTFAHNQGLHSAYRAGYQLVEPPAQTVQQQPQLVSQPYQEQVYSQPAYVQADLEPSYFCDLGGSTGERLFGAQAEYHELVVPGSLEPQYQAHDEQRLYTGYSACYQSGLPETVVQANGDETSFEQTYYQQQQHQPPPQANLFSSSMSAASLQSEQSTRHTNQQGAYLVPNNNQAAAKRLQVDESFSVTAVSELSLGASFGTRSLELVDDQHLIGTGGSVLQVSHHHHQSSQQLGRQHEEPELKVCEWDGCDNTFLSMNEFVKHLEERHVNREPREKNRYFCLWTNCKRNEQEFNARYKLLIHMRVHSGEKPYPCTNEDCKKSFSRLENLKIHVRSHTGEKPYKCNVATCNKSFTNSSDRIKHHKTHKDPKPYSCTYSNCNKRYTDPSSLRKHLRAHKRAQPHSSAAEGEQASRPPPTVTVTASFDPAAILEESHLTADGQHYDNEHQSDRRYHQPSGQRWAPNAQRAHWQLSQSWYAGSSRPRLAPRPAAFGQRWPHSQLGQRAGPEEQQQQQLTHSQLMRSMPMGGFPAPVTGHAFSSRDLSEL